MTVCGRSSVAGFWVVLPDVHALFEAKRRFTFHVTGARDRMVLEGRNVSLRGRRKEPDTW